MKKKKTKSITVRTMQQEDILSVAELEKECFSVPWSADAFRDSGRKEMYTFFVAVFEDIITGYAGIYYTCGEGNITNVAVGKQWRTKGVATMLLEHIFQNAARRRCDKIFLEVRISNLKAVSLYKKMGFEVLGTRKNFYEKPVEDALILCKNLPL